MEAGVGGDDEHYGGRKGRKARREGKGVRPLLLLAGNKPFEKLVRNQMDERKSTQEGRICRKLRSKMTNHRSEVCEIGWESARKYVGS